MKNLFRRNNDRVALGSRTETVTLPSAPGVDFSSFAPSAHMLSRSDLLTSYNTSQTDGLSRAEALRRLQRYGENMLEGGTGVSALHILLAQLGE